MYNLFYFIFNIVFANKKNKKNYFLTNFFLKISNDFIKGQSLFL